MNKPPDRYPIDRYLNVRSALGPTFSADNRYVAFISNITGNFEAWRIPFSAENDAILWPDQLTFIGDRVMSAVYSPTNPDLLLYSADSGGDENAQIFLQTFRDGELLREIKVSKGFENAMHMQLQWLPGGGGFLFVANRRRPDQFDLYIQPLDGPPTLIYAQDEPGYLAGVTVAPSGRDAVAVRTASSFSGQLLRIDLETGSAIDLRPNADAARYYAPHYAADGRHVYLLTDAASDFLHLARLDVAAQTLQPVVAPDWNVSALAQSADRRHLFYTVNEAGLSGLFLLDTTTGVTRQAPQFWDGPGVVVDEMNHISFSADSRFVAFTCSSSTRTFDVFVWDVEQDVIRPITRSSHGGLPVSSFANPNLITYKTFDGRDMPAWYFPPPEKTTPAPCVVVVHGGPESQWRPGFNFLVQYFVNNGYAVLAPNVRGSTGYGRAYSKLDDVRKRMDSVADLAHANLWLREQAEIDAGRIIVYGGSYGGFMVLSSLTTYPALWAAGVDIVGISSFVTFLENTSAYRRAHREAEYGSLEHDRDFLESISPLTHIDNIVAPLLIIHGRNDPRVPVSEAEQVAAILKERGVSAELLVFDDEGHGIVKLKNKRVMYARVVDFLSRL